METSKTLDILVVDRNKTNVELINNFFTKDEMSITFDLTPSIPELLAKLNKKTWQAIFLFIDAVPISVSAMIDIMPKLNRKCPIIVICKHYNRNKAIDYIQAGAQNVYAISEVALITNSTKKILAYNKLNETLLRQRNAIGESHARFLNLSNQLPTAIAYIQEGMFINTNPAFLKFFNLESPTATSEIPFLDLFKPSDIKRIKKAIHDFDQTELSHILIKTVNAKKKTANSYPVNLIISRTLIKGEKGLQIIFQPCETKAKSVKTISPQGLLQGKAEFLKSLNQSIKKSNKNYAISFCFFELDAYTIIKKNLGITRTEILLNEINDFMQSVTNIKIKISQLNSDVYTIIVTEKNFSACLKIIDDLQLKFCRHSFKSVDSTIKVASNIGVVHITDIIHSSNQAMSLADVACSVSRNRKLNQLHIYNPEKDRSTVEHIDQNSAAKITDAIKNDNFRLLFQPMISLNSESDMFYEVLLRIKSSGEDDILPNKFLQLAKKSNLEPAVDQWVIKNATKILKNKKQRNVRLFINLSDASLRDIGFIEWLINNCPFASNIVFEIPERSATKWPSETLHFIQTLNSLGGSCCIDNFGKHLENYSQIDELHAHYYKIDGKFVNNISTNRAHQSIIHNICVRSKRTKTKIIASHVQNADSMAFLWSAGIDYLQGNYLQPPAAHLDFKFQAQI